MIRSRLVVALALAAVSCWLAAPGAAVAHDPAASQIVQPVTEDGLTVTMRMVKVPLRGPHFEIREQRAGGGYATVPAPIGERSFLGTVDERPGAVASGIVAADGSFRGAIYFDRGATWFVRDGAAEKVEGLEAPAFNWPTLPTLSPGLIGSAAVAFDVAVDADNAFIADRYSNSPAQAFDAIEYSMSNLRAIYLHDGLLRPRLARVVLRTAPAPDPYASAADNGDRLDAVDEEWTDNQTDADRDTVIMAAGDAGGGLAYRPGLGKANGYAVSGANDGVFDDSGRHEVGHNFNAQDDHAGRPEGSTLLAGNDYSRFSGPELQAMIAYRDVKRDLFETPVRFDAAPWPPMRRSTSTPRPPGPPPQSTCWPTTTTPTATRCASYRSSRPRPRAERPRSSTARSPTAPPSPAARTALST